MPSYYTTTLFKMVGSTLKSCMPAAAILSLLIVFACSKGQNKQTLVFSQGENTIEAQARDYKIAFNDQQVGIQLESGEKASLQLATEAVAIKATKDELLYEEVAEHTDLKFYDKGNGNVGYDFILEPGADIEDVRFKLENGENAYINEDGELAIPVKGGEMRHSKPVAYQDIDGERIAVNSQFILEDGHLGFGLGEYDHSQTVVIDPEIYFAPAPVAFEEEEVFSSTLECQRKVTNSIHCTDDYAYVLYLFNDVENNTYESTNLLWEEYTDGTASLTGIATNNNGNGEIMTIEAHFSGRTSTAPSGSPRGHKCESPNSSDWYYYTSLSGTLTSSTTGEVIQISRKGSAIQVGYGANGVSTGLGFGASGWLNLSGSNIWTDGDFNLMLDENCELPVECQRTVTNTVQCSNGQNYVLYLAGDDGNAHYGTDNLEWQENTDGTASLTGTATNNDGGGEVMTIDISFSGKTNIPPAGNPKEHFCDNTVASGLYYYTSTSGTITSSTTGEVLQISRRGEAFQIGFGGNVTSSGAGFGASGWFSVSGSSIWSRGDFNLVLDENCEPPLECQRAVTNTVQCANGQVYVLYLAGSSGNSHYGSTNLTWQENVDGTVSLTGTATNNNGNGEVVTIDVNLSGRTNIPPSGSPKEYSCGGDITEPLLYYTSLSGTITSSTTGEVLQISRRDEAFQVGFGGNVTNAASDFGGSGWFSVSGSSIWNRGDFNLVLSEDCLECEQEIIGTVTTEDLTCEGGDGTLIVSLEVSGETTLPIEIYYTFEGSEILAGSFNSAGDKEITGLASGEYTNIRIVDANGCRDLEIGPFTIGTPTGCGGSESIMCEDGNVVMSMERLRANATTMETIDLPNIVTGLIEVSAFTFDEYASRGNVTQLNEQVKIQFLSQGEVVTETGFTTDIPDQVVRGEILTDFGQIDLGNLGVDQIKIVHADAPNSGFGATDGTPNSVQGVEICLVDLLEFDDCCNPPGVSLYTLPAPRVQDGTGMNTLEESFNITGVAEIQLCSRFNSFENLDKTGDYVDIFYKVDGGAFVKLANQNRDYSPCSQDTDPNSIDGSRTLSGVQSCAFDWFDYPVQAKIPVTGDLLTIKVVLAVDGHERIEMTSLTLCGEACDLEVDAGDPVTICDGEDATFTAEVNNAGSCLDCPDLGSDWTLIGELNGTGYYKFNNGGKSYTDARDLATAEGGFLPIVTSQEINDFLQSLITEGIWIGFTDEDVEGTFVWEDGSPVSYTNWNAGEPNNSGGEDYTEFLPSGKWNDLPNGNHQDVVIQVSCPTTDDITYTWSGPNNFSASTAEIMVGTAGTYMVTVEDCKGCIATDEVVLEVDDTEITTNENTRKEICDGESVTFTVQTNATNPPYTEIEFIRFSSMVADPYAASGGTFLGEFSLPANSGSITTSNFLNTNPKKNESYFVYACVKPAPADGACRPFVKYEVRIEDNPDVEFTTVDPDCDELTGSINFTFNPHDDRGNIEFQVVQNGNIIEAYSDNNVGDGSSPYAITGLEPGTYDVFARWGNDECEVDLGQAVIDPISEVCDVPELCTEGVIIDFDTAPDGTPLIAGTTNFAALQPYKAIFGIGSGVQFSTDNPSTNPLNLYDSEGSGGADTDLERNTGGDGFWSSGNLANAPLFNLLIINQTDDIGNPNDNNGGGLIISTANQFLDEFSFDVVDVNEDEIADTKIIFENTITGESAEVPFADFEDIVANTSMFKVTGVDYGNRSANRITGITANKLGISAFDKVTFMLGDGVTIGIGSICFKLAELGAIGNYVWVDEDSNGLQDAGEPGIPNVRVNLFYDTDGSGGLNGDETTPIATTFTDAQGGYLFPGLPQGMYFVKVDDTTIPMGMTQTTIFTNVVDGSDADIDPDDGDLGNKDQSGDGYKITLDTGEENLTADFGYNYNPTDDVNNDDDVAAIGDRVWIDSDGDGVQDPNEIGVEGVELTLTGAGDDGVFGTGDDVTATTTTDENGYYLFDNLEPGAYMTEVTDDAGATYEVLNTTDYDQTGDPDDFGEPATAPDNKLTDAVVLGPGDVFLNADYGYQPTDANDSVSAIGDYVWFDADKDGSGPSAESPDEGGGAITQGAGGTADPSEYGIEGVSVALIRDENANGIWDDGEPIIATDVTDENGFYYFPDLIEDDGTGTDDYLVWVNDTDNVLDDLKPTFDKDGGDVPFETGAPLGEDADNVLGISAVTNLGTAAAPGAFRLMQDFGYAPRTNSIGDGLIGDYVWFDDNRDGVQDPDEEGIEGVVVELYDLGADDMVGGGDDVLIATATTNENGYYYFDGLPLDDDEGDNDFAYQVIIADENFDPGKPLQGFENTSDPDSGTASPDNEGGAVVLNGGNTQDLDQDFGYAGQNGSTPVGSIGDTVFEDRDADGVRDAGEEGIPGVTIDLYRDLNGNGELDPGEPKIGTETTDANGMYLFTDLPIDDGGGDDDADYIVDVTDVNGVLIGYWHSTSPNQDASTNVGDDDVSMDDTGDNSKEDAFAVSLNAMIPNNRNVDFGYYKDLAALGNYVWIDVNENGLQDDGETGINDVEVTLTIEYPNDDVVTVVVTTEDDADGNPGFYDFPNLLADEDYNMGTFGDPSSDGLPLFTISVDEDQPEFTDNNLVPTIDDVNANTDDLADSDDFAGVVAKPVQGSEDTSAKDPSTTEEEIASYDFGVKESLPGAIGNYVWLDENSDGFQDIGEPGIPNVQVDLKDENGVVISTTYTDANGGYLFPDLAEGTYFVDVVESTLPDGVTQTTVFTNSADDKPFDDIDDGDFGNKDQGVSFGYQVDLDSGEENMTADFGYNYNPTDDVDNGEDTAALGDRVWIDSDGDGMQDPEEIGVSGVEVTLTGAGPDGEFGTGDDITDMTTTDDNGFYLFDNLAPGAYMVEVTDDDGASHDVLEDSDYAQTGDPDDFGMPAMNPDDKTTTPVILAPGDVFLNADFGYQPNNNAPLGSIGNTVWLDADADGNGPSDVNGDSSNGAGVEDDDNEEPIPAVSVALVKDTNGNGEWDAGEPIIATDVTDENGQYLFEDLPVTNGAGSDDYIVVITDTDNVLSDLKATYDKDGGADQTGSLAPVSGTPTDPADVLGVTAVSNLTTTPVTDADFGYTPEGQDDGEGLIGDFVWFDNDGDGNQDPDEPGIEGVIVELFDPGADMMPGGGDDVLLFTTTTDENGNYYFGGLDADNDKYYVKVADENFDPNGVLEGMENTEDPDSDDDNEGATVTLTNADPVDLDQDFGYRAPMNADGSIGNFVWEDLNADGNVDAGEMGIDGITLDLYRDLNSNGVVDPGEPLFSTTTTANGGAYLFENLPFGDYIVDVTDEAGLLNGYWHSLGDQAELGTDNESKVDPYGADGGITISSIARDYLLADFGYYVRPAALGNFVWEDLNGDGIQDANEPGINGVEVTLTIMYPDGVTTTTVKTTTSTINGKDGSYNFGNLLLDEDYNTGTNGNPTVDDLPKFTISVDEAQTAIDNLNLVPTLIDVMTGGATDLNDSDDPAGVIGIPTQGQENTTPLANPTLEEVIASYDFGFAKFVSLGSTVFLDQNNNGFQDDVDNGIQGVDVFLFRDTNENGVIDGMEGDTPFRMTTTDANGNYFFGRLREGKYQVVIPADNFQPGGALNAFSVSSSGAATTDNEDRDDNGDQAFIGAETVSQVVMLMAGMEPVSGNGPMDESNAFGGGQDGPDGTPRDKSGNMTIDFGFQSIPLPVELIAFKATPDVDHIDLTWITASEIDNDYFDLERSEDGKSFKAITQLDGQGTTLEQVTYAYEDATVQPNVLYYYRLKQVDFDGTSEYSEIVTAQINGEKEGGMELYPNPVGVGSTLNVRFFTEEFTAELYIMDIQGRIIRTIKRDIVNTGWNIIEIEVADLAAGTYLIADRSGEIREFVKTE